jgi:hypothetical protein
LAPISPELLRPCVYKGLRCLNAFYGAFERINEFPEKSVFGSHDPAAVWWRRRPEPQLLKSEFVPGAQRCRPRKQISHALRRDSKWLSKQQSHGARAALRARSRRHLDASAPTAAGGAAYGYFFVGKDRRSTLLTRFAGSVANQIAKVPALRAAVATHLASTQDNDP